MTACEYQGKVELFRLALVYISDVMGDTTGIQFLNPDRWRDLCYICEGQMPYEIIRKMPRVPVTVQVGVGGTQRLRFDAPLLTCGDLMKQMIFESLMVPPDRQRLFENNVELPDDHVIMPDVNSAPSIAMSMQPSLCNAATHLHFTVTQWPEPNSRIVSLDVSLSLTVNMSHARATLILRESPSYRKELSKQVDSFMDDLKKYVTFKLCTVRPTLYLHEQGNVYRWDRVHGYGVYLLFIALRKQGIGRPKFKLDFQPQVKKLVASFLILSRQDYETLSDPVAITKTIHYLDQRGNPISVCRIPPSAPEISLDKFVISCKAADGAPWKKNTNYRFEVSVRGYNTPLFSPTTSFPYWDPYKSSYISSQGFRGLCRTIDFYTGTYGIMGAEQFIQHGWSRQLGLDVGV